MLDIYLAAVGGLALVLGLFSRKLRDLPVSAPLIAFTVGLALGPVGANVVHIPAGERPEILATAAELVLALSLMGIALRYPTGTVRDHAGSVALLIAVVMIGMAAIVAGLGLLALPLSVAGALLLGAALAPTDPVLASSIVAGEPAENDLPLRLRVLISLESGANDGLAAPLVILGIAAVSQSSWAGAAGDILIRLGVGIGVGVVLGEMAGRLLLFSERHREIEHAAFLAFTLSLTALVLGTAKLLHGEGIIAVFVAGLVYNHRLSQSERSEEWEVQEAINGVLVLPVFTVFGVAIPWSGWGELGWRGILFVALVLALRRLPLLAVLRRPLELGNRDAAFAGWFGPIGVAALFYLSHAAEVGADPPGVWEAGSLVIAVSIVVHGITATPFRRLYARSKAPASGGERA